MTTHEKQKVTGIGWGYCNNPHSTKNTRKIERNNNMEKVLNAIVDEFTLTLLPTKESNSQEWDKNRNVMIQTFIFLSKLKMVYGTTAQADKSKQAGYKSKQAGYTDSLIFPDKPLLSISWHKIFDNMGVCVHFSALAWTMYQTRFSKTYHEYINVADFLRMVQSEVYVTRLSRIDFVADYKNFPSSASPDTVCVHFSALAWTMYQTSFSKTYHEYINVADFLRMVQSEVYVTRLSRIDFVADYKNFPSSASPDTIYRGMIEEKLIVRNCENRKVVQKKEGLKKKG